MSILIGVLVVGFVLYRQMQTRRAKETSAMRLMLVLGVIGVIEISHALKGHSLGSTAIAWLVGSLVVGGVLGAVRAMTVTVWRGEDGAAWRRGTVLTAVLWLVSLGAHFAMEAGLDSASKIDSLGAASILLYLAITPRGAAGDRALAGGQA